MNQVINKVLILIVFFSFNQILLISQDNTLKDIDGNSYPIVFIGDQEWMAQNLKTTRYNDGTLIAGGLEDYDWRITSETRIGAIAVYPYKKIEGIDSEIEMIETYGILYNWHAVIDDRGLCPEGWRIPSEEDWQVLSDYLQEKYYIIDDTLGNTLKSCRQIDSPLKGLCSTSKHPRWNFDETHYGTDNFGFSALPAGFRGISGTYRVIGEDGYWWTSSEHALDHATYIAIFYDSGILLTNHRHKSIGLSVRCMRDKQ